MLTGFKGVKYGLQPGAKAKQKGLVSKPLAAFVDDDDSEGVPNIGKDIARQAAKKRADAKVAQQHAAALAEDASVFDYDGVYDDIQAQRVQPKKEEKLARKSRYIEGLLNKAKEREREQDIVYERKLAKEREAEDHLFGDKDKFLTAAYKKKLEEDQKWLAEERLREAAEKRDSVVSRGHMGDFYRNVLTNNSAFGTSQSKAAPVAAAAADAQAAAPAGGAKPGAGDGAWEAARRAREAYEEAQAARQDFTGSAQGLSESAERSGAALAAEPAAGAGLPPGASKAGAEEGAAGGERSAKGAGAPEKVPQGSARGQGSAAEAGAERQAAGADTGSNPGAPDPASESGVGRPAETPAEKAAKAVSARERYLARKRKAPGLAVG